ncbi:MULTISPECIES: site-specific integrase [unclassified Micromonospora]|uniref:tyrosine-type recombinase/integrase n=1 Tax=unclassified Micromonospora TaxID=2617518 RepID=UPI0020B2E776|nr:MULTISPECIES: site-specific integrase [unclassified Micromonospora]MDM4783287.1 site-specific integrase [Micromonospora sp. b486]
MITAVSIPVWRVRFTHAELPVPSSPLPGMARVCADWPGWLAQSGVEPGTPFLVSPSFEFDVVLNGFFQEPAMRAAAATTQSGYARNVAAFLSFLWSARGGRSWRDATEDDHVAYLVWRRRDADGPRVAGATWDREVAAVNRFYRWAVRRGHVQHNPVPQVSRRPTGLGTGWARARTLDEQRPATYSHDAARERVQWLPPESYRRWRDVGVRGFTSEGLPGAGFRGRWAGRNSAFCDLMVRTGLRLSEQAALTVFDVPLGRGAGGYQRFWLAEAVAKGRSARWIYVPSTVAVDLGSYAEWDRVEVIEQAQAAGRYALWRRPWVVEDPERPEARRTGSGQRVNLAHLGLPERRQVLVDGPHGLAPAWFWLGETGLPLSVSAWKAMFAEANRRCAVAGLPLRCHAHMLRHTFAVVTLEQLQRGHIAALAELVPQQREHYTRIFGDPLDWVRRRLGHRSAVTTQIYLHALAELEMHTRMTLVPDSWDTSQEAAVHDAGVGA